MSEKFVTQMALFWGRERTDGAAADDRPGIVDVPEQWLVLVTCRDEKLQVELLQRFGREGLECWALVS
jgi:hypothetical protein